MTIDKDHLRKTMLELSKSELEQARATYERFLGEAMIDKSETVEVGAHAQAKTNAELASAFDDQAHGYEEKIQRLENVDFGAKTEVEEGAVVKIGDRHLVVAVSSSEFICNDVRFVGISTDAPIFEQMEGKRAGETCEFRGQPLTIAAVY